MRTKKTISTESDKEGGSKLFIKMMAVLNCFTRANGQLSISEIVEMTGLPRTTVHRIVASLRDIELLDQNGRRQTYRLGLQMFYFGSVVMANLDLNTHAHPHILALHQLTGEVVHLHIFDGSQMVCIEREEMSDTRLTTLTTIEAAPTHCTGVGKAFLAFQTPELISRIASEEKLKRRTPNTLTTMAELETELALFCSRSRLLRRRRRKRNRRPLHWRANSRLAWSRVCSHQRLDHQRAHAVGPDRGARTGRKGDRRKHLGKPWLDGVGIASMNYAYNPEIRN